MHIRVTISAVIGANRQSMAISASFNDQGEFRMDFPKDLNWAHSIYLILEPDDETVYKDRYLRGKDAFYAKSYRAKSYRMAAETASAGDPVKDVEVPDDYCHNCRLIGGKHTGNCIVEAKEA